VSYRGRFAPSPTGPLHFGSLVAAAASWLDARAQGGEWLVRIEDVDEARTVPGAAEAILRQLDALGFDHDGEVAWQSHRKPLYEEALGRLRERSLVYRCRCSRKEVADSALAGIEGPVYPGTCRALGLGTAVPGADRLRVNPGRIEFVDRVQGPIAQQVDRDVGDFVLKRRDGLHAYQLAVVVDDAAQGITDVVRGADLLSSTPRQVVLQRLLGYPTPRYLHFPVATNARGEKLSKQTLAPSVEGGDGALLLDDVLEFLGQERVGSRDPREVLHLALARWDPRRIPAVTARRAPGERPPPP